MGAPLSTNLLVTLFILCYVVIQFRNSIWRYRERTFSFLQYEVGTSKYYLLLYYILKNTYYLNVSKLYLFFFEK